MALVNCPECHCRVSATKLTCPFCGTDIREQVRETLRGAHTGSEAPEGGDDGDKSRVEIQTIQRTSKEIKAQQVWAGTVVVASLALIGLSIAAWSSTLALLGCVTLAVGGAWSFLAMTLKWWHHG